MRRGDSERYLQYTASAPFMFRLPKFVSTVITFLMRLLLKKNRPETGKELVATFAVHATLLILLSSPFVLLDFPTGVGWSGWPGYMPGILEPLMNL
jgi:hypothetical protein